MTGLALAAPQVDRLSLMLAALALGAAAVLIMRKWPRLGVLAWFGVVAFVPDWLGLKAGPYLTPTTLMAMAVLASLIPLTVPRLGTADLLVGAFFAACLLPLGLGLGSLRVSVLFTLATVWILAFTLGRLVPLKVDLEWIGKVFAIVMGVVALLALAEFLLTWNPFVGIPALGGGDRSFSVWSRLQARGGVLRAEGAFGHSIALGASLALAIPFAIGSRIATKWRVVLALLLVGGIAVTFSRAAMLAGAAALLLSVYGLRHAISRRVRLAVLIGGLFTVAALQPLVAGVFTDASSEAANSSSYREALLSLLGSLALVGESDAARITASGESLYGQFNSVDSALLLVGLNFGVVALALGVAAYLAAVVLVLRRRGGPAMIAVVAQGPALLTVALITQYAPLFWFVTGLAVYAVSRQPAHDGEQRAAPAEHSEAAGPSLAAAATARPMAAITGG